MIYTYNRVSTSEQQSSTEQQESYLLEFCKRKGFENAISLIDSDISGSKSLFNRPEGAKLKNLTAKDVLIVTKHDRLFRNFLDAVNIINQWFDDGVTIYILNLGETPINLENYIQKFTLYNLMLAAELERDMIRERTKKNLMYRKENHKTYSRPPYGWDNVGERGTNGKLINGQLKINEKEQEIISLMRDLRTAGNSYSEIANELNLMEVPTKEGGQWSKGTVQKILNNALNG